MYGFPIREFGNDEMVEGLHLVVLKSRINSIIRNFV